MNYLKNEQLNTTANWMNVNKLGLNIAKTKAVFFRTNNVINKCTEENLKYLRQLIAILSKHKYLGVILDSPLTIKDHVHYTYNKVVSHLRMLGKARQVAGKHICLFLYKSHHADVRLCRYYL